MSGGRSARDKGSRVERRIVGMHRAIGCRAMRVPLSGAAQGFRNDVCCASKSGHVAFEAEVKARAGASGWKMIEGWLAEADALFLVRDRAEPLVVLPWSLYAKLMERA